MRPPHSIEAALAQAISLANTGQHREAAALCDTLPPHPAVWQLRAVLWHEAGRLAEARTSIDASLALRPEHAPSLMVLAQIASDQGDDVTAERALVSVLDQQPTLAAAAVNLGILLQAQGRFDEAMRRFGQAHAARPETFGRIAHALSTPARGALWLDPAALRRALEQAHHRVG